MQPLDDGQQRAVQAAIQAAQQAYAPYSQYHVGAALLAADGRIFTGCNVENASYPAGICAERGALAKAVSEGARDFSLVVVATQNGGSPCGICRQSLLEFSPAARVLCVTFEGLVHVDSTVAELLPFGFSPRSLI
ncbi:cytidine deaminase [Aggregatilineales bacterium SYSU G02658]